MLIIMPFKRPREGAKRKSPSFPILILIPVIAIGLLAYSSVPLVRVKANGGESTGSERAKIFKSIADVSAVPRTPITELTNATFRVRGLAGKCITAGKLRMLPGDVPYENNDPVFLYECNGTDNQQVQIVELSPGTYRGGSVKPREVQLHAAGK